MQLPGKADCCQGKRHGLGVKVVIKRSYNPAISFVLLFFAHFHSNIKHFLVFFFLNIRQSLLTLSINHLFCNHQMIVQLHQTL